MTITASRSETAPTIVLPTISRGARHVHRSPGRWSLPVALLALVMAQSIVVLDLDLPVLRALVGLVTLLGVPTLVLHRRVDFPADTAVARLLYAFGVSLLGVIVVGLALNTVLPLVGIDRPLQPMVLGITWLVVDGALLLWRRSAPLVETAEVPRAAKRLLGARWEPAQALALLSVVAAVVGAVRLNNDAGGLVAWVAPVLTAAALLTLLLRPGTLARDVRTIAAAAAALLLATSLRGWHITGHDIQAEFFAFRLTDSNQHWSMELLQNAYNACLSVTILPTVLAQTTGLSGEIVFKVVLQLVFALVPVVVYLLSRRFLPRRLALASAIFTMAFPTFFTDMPYLVRQEIAFLFLALALLAATEPGRSARMLRSLVLVFGVGVVLSHYSTTYLLMMGLVAGLVVLGLWLLLLRRAREERRPLVLLSPVTVAALAAASVLWTGPVTETGGHAADVAKATLDAVLGKGVDLPRSSDVSYWLLAGDDASPRERLDLFVDETIEARGTVDRSQLLIRDLGPQELRPDIFPVSKVPPTFVGEALKDVGVRPSVVDSLLRFGSAAAMQLFLLLGVAAMAFVGLRRSLSRKDAKTDAEGHAADNGADSPADGTGPEIVAVVIGCMAALGLVVVVPTLSVEYGVLRAFQQTMLVVAPLMAVGLALVLRLFRGRAAVLTVAVPVAVLLALTGILSSLVGGNPGRLALHNAGPYYERYLAPDSDVQAMSWVAGARDTSGDMPKVIADRSFTLRIMAAADSPVDAVDRLYPSLLTRDSYVFVDTHLTRTRKATVFYSGDRISYRYPLAQLDRRLDLVYSSGGSRVYR